jgi:hypothetical protein
MTMTKPETSYADSKRRALRELAIRTVTTRGAHPEHVREARAFLVRGEAKDVGEHVRALSPHAINVLSDLLLKYGPRRAP